MGESHKQIGPSNTSSPRIDTILVYQQEKDRYRNRQFVLKIFGEGLNFFEDDKFCIRFLIHI